MNIGDRVRILHGTEEGIITRIIDTKTVEIEIKEGFTIPVLNSDLVKITDQEDRYFTEEKRIEPSVVSKEVHADRGVFLALELVENLNKYRIHLINNTDLDIVSTIFKKEGKLRFSGIYRGLVGKRSTSVISFFSATSLSTYNELYCQVLYFDPTPGTISSPVERQIRIAGLLASKKSEQSPIIGIPSWLKQIDDQAEVEKPAIEGENTRVEGNPVDLVDLHAEALGIDENVLSPNEILELQIKAFNESLDKALIFGLGEITFIHGLGQGTLKNRIVKEIKNRSGIRYWEDAKKEKFGHGAIKIVL